MVSTDRASTGSVAPISTVAGNKQAAQINPRNRNPGQARAAVRGINLRPPGNQEQNSDPQASDPQFQQHINAQRMQSSWK